MLVCLLRPKALFRCRSCLSPFRASELTCTANLDGYILEAGRALTLGLMVGFCGVFFSEQLVHSCAPHTPHTITPPPRRPHPRLRREAVQPQQATAREQPARRWVGFAGGKLCALSLHEAACLRSCLGERQTGGAFFFFSFLPRDGGPGKGCDVVWCGAMWGDGGRVENWETTPHFTTPRPTALPAAAPPKQANEDGFTSDKAALYERLFNESKAGQALGSNP